MKEHFDHGTWRHKRVTLAPDSDRPEFDANVLEDLVEGELSIATELVEVFE